LLLISASPIENSSTELLLRRIADSIASVLPDTNCEIVHLNDLKFRPCQACGEAPQDGFCIYDDDLTSVYKQVAECDCLLFGTPIYFDTVSAQAKMFIDRCNCFRPPDYDDREPDHDFIKLLDRERPGAMVLVGGKRGWFEGARRVVAGFFKWIEVVNLGQLCFASDDFRRAGLAAEDAKILAEADELGRRLAEDIAGRKHSKDDPK
jgi:hypothetical protein